MQNEWLFGIAARLEKEIRRLLEPTSGIKEHLLMRNLDPHSKVRVDAKAIDNHLRSIVGIDDDFTDTKGTQSRKRNLQEGTTRDGNKRLGAIVGEWPQSRAQACRQNHRFHS